MDNFEILMIKGIPFEISRVIKKIPTGQIVGIPNQAAIRAVSKDLDIDITISPKRDALKNYSILKTLLEILIDEY